MERCKMWNEVIFLALHHRIFIHPIFCPDELRPAVSPLLACCHRAALSFVKEAKKLAEPVSQASHATFLHFHSTAVQINVEKKPLRKFNLVIVWPPIWRAKVPSFLFCKCKAFPPSIKINKLKRLK